MNVSIRTKWLGSLLGLCVIAIVVESYFLWSAEKSGFNKTPADKGQVFSAIAPKVSSPWFDDWDPNGQLKQMQQQMNRLMNQMSAASSAFTQQRFGPSQESPTISMHEEPDKYKVIVDVPKGENVQINTDVTGNQLTIDGKVRQTREGKSANADMQSLSISQFSQTMSFPEPVKDSDVKVTRNNNQIVITVPKIG
jgi:HSP20 family protein